MRLLAQLNFPNGDANAREWLQRAVNGPPPRVRSLVRASDPGSAHIIRVQAEVPAEQHSQYLTVFGNEPGVKLETWQEDSKRLIMPIEQMNISLPPKMARFIRSKVKDGQYTNASEVVRDAVRHMQETDAARSERALLADFEGRLPAAEREDIRRSVKRGVQDIDTGRFEEYDAEGLRGLTKELVAGSVKKRASRAKAG